MARITIIGGTGYAGSNIARAAAARGHQVTSLSRTLPAERLDGVEHVSGSVLDTAFLARVTDGADVVVSALSPRGELAGRTRGVIAEVAAQAAAAGVRLGVVGGAGSLQVAPGGPKVVETEGFPEEFKAEALEMEAVLDDLRASQDLDWFYLSPAGGFGAFAPGEAKGAYRTGDDVLLVDDEGRSEISGPDLAAAVVDEIETPAHRRRRFTVAY